MFFSFNIYVGFNSIEVMGMGSIGSGACALGTKEIHVK
jgi:hypothetical protein